MSGFLTGRTSLTTVQTADIAANAIDGTLTKDALVGDYSDVTVTAADLIMYGDATDSNNTKRDTVQGVLDLVSSGITNITEVAATSGTSITVSGIGSSADFVYMTLEDINMTGTAVLKLRIGPSGGVATSGYLNSGGDLEAADTFVNLTSTTYFNVSNVTNTNDVKQGHILMTHHGGNIWMVSWQLGDSSQNSVALGAGKIGLSGALEQVQFYGGTFEGANGAIAVGYL